MAPAFTFATRRNANAGICNLVCSHDSGQGKKKDFLWMCLRARSGVPKSWCFRAHSQNLILQDIRPRRITKFSPGPCWSLARKGSTARDNSPTDAQIQSSAFLVVLCETDAEVFILACRRSAPCCLLRARIRAGQQKHFLGSAATHVPVFQSGGASMPTATT